MDKTRKNLDQVEYIENFILYDLPILPTNLLDKLSLFIYAEIQERALEEKGFLNDSKINPIS